MAGVTLGSEGGQVGGGAHGPAIRTRLWVPEEASIRIASDDLVYGGKGRWRDADTDLLDQFLSVESRSWRAISIIGFVSRHGPLRICAHGLPASHNAPVWAQPGDATAGRRTRGCPPLGGPDEYREPLAAWRRFVTMARAIVRISDALRLAADSRGNPDDWCDVYGDQAAERLPLLVAAPAAERAELARWVTWWLAVGDARPVVDWSAQYPQAYWQATTLFGAIGIQLVRRVAIRKEVIRCRYCGIPFMPYKAARSDRGNYCPDCQREEVPLRLAQEKYRRGKSPGPKQGSER